MKFDKEIKKLKKKLKIVGREFEEMMDKGEHFGKRYSKDLSKEFHKLKNEMNEKFDNVFRENDLPGKFRHALSHVGMVSDVEDKGSHIVVRIALPGVEKKDVILRITNDHIEVNALRREHAEVNAGRIHKKMVSEKKYHRLIPLPRDLEHDHAQTSFKNGMLTIIMQKKKIDKRIRLR